MNKKIYFIYTGGTIGMKRNSQGALVPTTSEFEKKVRSIQEIQQTLERNNASFELTLLKKTIDSTNLRPEDWWQILKSLKNEFDNYDAFIIIHGTDTLAYTSSMLSFLLKGVSKPIIITGAQVSLFEDNSDGIRNICGAISSVCSNPVIQGINVCFGDYILHGARTTKISSTQLNAFFSPNSRPIGKVNANGTVQVDSRQIRDYSNVNLSLLELKRENLPIVSVVKVYPGFNPQILKSFISDDKGVKRTTVDAIVLEAYGSGNWPNNNPELNKTLEDLVKYGAVLCVGGQPIHGSVKIGNYDAGRLFQEIGALSCGDMTTEASVCKVMFFLMSKTRRMSINKRFSIPIANECTEAYGSDIVPPEIDISHKWIDVIIPNHLS